MSVRRIDEADVPRNFITHNPLLFCASCLRNERHSTLNSILSSRFTCDIVRHKTYSVVL